MAIWRVSGIDVQQIVLMVIENVVTDCIDADFSSTLPSLRKQDILGGIRSTLDALLQFAYEFLQHCISRYVAEPQSNRLAEVTEIFSNLLDNHLLILYDH